jgi:hypothetical protein
MPTSTLLLQNGPGYEYRRLGDLANVTDLLRP